LGTRLDHIAQKLDHRDQPAYQFARELIQVTSQEKTAQMSQKNANLIRILWEIDWNSWIGGRNGKPAVSVPANPLAKGDLPVDMKILSDLSFTQIDAREKAISKAHADTFKWLFQDRETDPKGEAIKWPSYPLWLQETSGSLYWVTGKPGSGKSTLMKYIFESEQLEPLLAEYARDLPLLLAGFFFWNPGAGMQKSREGLLRTLLYQCLMARKDLIPAVAPRRWALYNILGSDATAPEWTWRELTESFERLCSYNGKEFRLALFIDGLDEFDGAETFPEVLVGWIKDVVQQHSIKVCVSSRPWNTFSDAFRHDRSLKMQDLTKRDIQRFVHAEFGENPAFTELREVFTAEADQLLKDIVEKAEGVFLWVKLVVRSLLSALTDTPSIPHLQKILAETPGDIMGLYDSIWRCIPSGKRTSASKLFQLFRVRGGEDPVTFWLAYEGPAVRASTVLDKAKREGIPKLLKRLLDGHTRGLMETTSERVGPLHRSVTDWMQRKKTWDEIRQQTPAEFDPSLEFLEAILVSHQSESSMSNPRDVDIANFCVDFLHQAQIACLRPGVDENRLVRVLDELDKFTSDKATTSSNLRMRTSVAIGSTHPNRGLFSTSGWPSINLQMEYQSIEVCFVGIAAGSGLVPYVRAKVRAHPDLLVAKPRRESLLETAIFPEKQAYPLRRKWEYFMIPGLEDSRDQRLEIIQFLLDTATVQYKSSMGKALISLVTHARAERKGDGSLDDDGFYRRVHEMLLQHGYKPGEGIEGVLDSPKHSTPDDSEDDSENTEPEDASPEVPVGTQPRTQAETKPEKSRAKQPEKRRSTGKLGLIKRFFCCFS
jgi:hypothetical protein